MHRQIRALLAAGHEVTYVAPFTDCNVTPPPEIRAIDVPRASGRRRRRALRAAWSALRRGIRDADVLLVHDLELLLVLPPARRRPPTVWDVHEDTASALESRTDLPAFARHPLRALIRRLEDRAERHLSLILAEESLRERFPGGHPVVPNTTYVSPVPPPPPKDRRIVYVGRLSHARGAAEMVELARRLAPHDIRLDLIGPADPPIRPMLRDAQRTGLLDWYGHVPNRHALRMAEGALAGLSLPHDAPHHRRSLPAKVIEYMARGVPVVTTPLPMAASIVGRVDCGVIVPFGDVEAAARAVLRLKDDPERRAAMGSRGYAAALHHFHWPDDAAKFVGYLERLAAAPAAVPSRDHKTGIKADHGDAPAETLASGPHYSTPMTGSRPA